MIGYLVRCHLPLPELGRLDLPKARIRYRNGFIRVWHDRAKDRLTAILEDRAGHAIPLASQAEARAESLLMGRALAVALQRHTRYEVGEETGDRNQVRVAV